MAQKRTTKKTGNPFALGDISIFEQLRGATGKRRKRMIRALARTERGGGGRAGAKDNSAP